MISNTKSFPCTTLGGACFHLFRVDLTLELERQVFRIPVGEMIFNTKYQIRIQSNPVNGSAVLSTKI